MATMTTPAGLELFMDRQGDELCAAMVAAEERAAAVRREVDAYIEPLFLTYGFTDKRTGKPLQKSDQLYLTDADATAFYAECDRLHRERGHDLPEGHCPALIAENDVIHAQAALIDAAGQLLGFESWQVHGENRKKLLGIFRQMYAARCRRNRRLRQLVRETIAAN